MDARKEMLDMPKETNATEIRDIPAMDWPDPGETALESPADDDTDDSPADAGTDPSDDTIDKTDKKTGEPKDKPDGWDKSRQAHDETNARVRKMEDRLGSISDTVTSLPAQIRDMVAGMVTKIGDSASGTEGGTPPADSADELMAQIKEIDPDTAGYDVILGVLKGLAEKVQSTSAVRSEISQALKDLKDKDSARDTRDTRQQAKTMISDEIDSLEREYFGGKRTHRANLITGAQELCGKMGFDLKTNPPPASTALMALRAVASELSAADKASRRVKDALPVTDNMASGTVVDFGGDKNLSLAEAMASMKSEGKFD